MVLKKVILNNFQSHDYTEIEVAPTLTVIVGESDNGKSAIVRAIRWVLFNEPRGSDFIRAGASECSVSLIYDDGVTVTRVRSVSGNKNRYIISRPGENEQIFEGFGTSVPEEVISITGVKKIKIDDDVSVDLHTAPQLEPPFLLMESGSVKARAIGQLTGTDIFDFAHRKVTQDLNRIKDDLKQERSELDALSDSLKEYEDLPQLESIIQKVRGFIENADLSKERLAFLSEKRETIKNNDRDIKIIDSLINDLKNLDSIENVVLKGEALYQRYVSLIKLRRSFDALVKDINFVECLIKGTAGLEQCWLYLSELDVMVYMYETVKGLRDKYNKNAKDLRIIHKALEDMQYLDVIEDMYNRLIENTQRLNSLVSIKDKVYDVKERLRYVEEVLNDCSELSSVEQLSSKLQKSLELYGQLVKIRAQIERLNQDTDTVEKDINRAQKALKDMVTQYEKLLKTLKRCPVCFSSISDERAHEIACSMADLS